MSFIITILIITSLIVLVRVGYKNTKLVNVKHVHINKKSSESKTTIHVLHISDMHLENISITPGELYDILKDEKIDLIALTGDFLDRKRSIPKMAKYLEVLNKLQPAYGSYAVFGNHDYVLNEKYFHELEQLLKQYGVKTMRNTNDTLYVEGQAVNIVGIDDYSTKRGNLDKSYENVNEKDYTLVLTHDPNIVLRMKKYHFDYFLSGHFHGGQICWPKPYQLTKLGKMGKLPSMNIYKGLHYVYNRPYYISEGLGQTGVNIRFGSQPEITIHHIKIPKQTKENREKIVNVS